MLDCNKAKVKGFVKLYAQMMNISPEGMRFFEQKGILNPERDDESGYRLYGGDESNLMVQCKKYRAYGFRLDEVVDILKEPSSERICEILEDRYESMKQEIKELEELLLLMSRELTQIRSVGAWDGCYTTVQRPPFYYLPTRINKMILDDEDSIAYTSEWNGYSPSTDTFVLGRHFEPASGEKEIVNGHLIEADIAKGLPLSGGTYLPGAACLYSVTRTTGFLDSLDQMFLPMLDYMERNGIEPKGDPLGRRARLYVDDENQYHYICQIWIPI